MSRTTFRLHTVASPCRLSTQSRFLLAALLGRRAGSAWRVPLTGLSHRPRGTPGCPPLALECTTSKHTPPFSFWLTRMKNLRQCEVIDFKSQFFTLACRHSPIGVNVENKNDRSKHEGQGA